MSHVLVAGPASGEITRVAVMAGSGGELFDRAAADGAQAIVTGEARHHDALRVAARGVTLVCALHSNSERVATKNIMYSFIYLKLTFISCLYIPNINKFAAMYNCKQIFFRTKCSMLMLVRCN